MKNGTVAHAVANAREEAAVYRQGEDRPLGGYLAVMAVFAALLAGAVGLAAAQRRRSAVTVTPWDVTLLAVGTHKLSRTLTKDAVTSPLRVPFTRYSDTGGPAEVMEEVREERTARHALGELLSCPFCLDMWIVTGFALGLVFAPRATRLIASGFTALAGADVLQLYYSMLQQRSESGGAEPRR